MSQQVSFLVAFATVFGMAEAIRGTQASTRRKEHRSRKNNLLVHCPKSSQFSPMLDGRAVVLSGDKLYIDTGTHHDVPFGHPFAGYYLPFPDAQYEGLVSSISDDPPVMNWIYIDAATHELKFGTRPWAEPNYNGPFDCTRQDRRLTFGAWEGFYAVREPSGFWALYFDLDGDGLAAKLGPPMPVVVPGQSSAADREAPPTPTSAESEQADGADGAQPEDGEKKEAQLDANAVPLPPSPAPTPSPSPTPPPPRRAGPAIPVNLLRIEMRVAKPASKEQGAVGTQDSDSDREEQAKDDQDGETGGDCTTSGTTTTTEEDRKPASRAACVEDELESPEVD